MVRGKQRYKCKNCGHSFIAGDIRTRVSAQGKALAVLLYGRGKASYGFIAKLFNVSPIAVMRWLKYAAQDLAAPALDNSITGVQFDEMRHFVVKKTQIVDLAGSGLS
jgi:transposase-like protein